MTKLDLYAHPEFLESLLAEQSQWHGVRAVFDVVLGVAFCFFLYIGLVEAGVLAQVSWLEDGYSPFFAFCLSGGMLFWFIMRIMGLIDLKRSHRTYLQLVYYLEDDKKLARLVVGMMDSRYFFEHMPNHGEVSLKKPFSLIESLLLEILVDHTGQYFEALAGLLHQLMTRDFNRGYNHSDRFIALITCWHAALYDEHGARRPDGRIDLEEIYELVYVVEYFILHRTSFYPYFELSSGTRIDLQLLLYNTVAYYAWLTLRKEKMGENMWRVYPTVPRLLPPDLVPDHTSDEEGEEADTAADDESVASSPTVGGPIANVVGPAPKEIPADF